MTAAERLEDANKRSALTHLIGNIDKLLYYFEISGHAEYHHDRKQIFALCLPRGQHIRKIFLEKLHRRVSNEEDTFKIV